MKATKQSTCNNRSAIGPLVVDIQYQITNSMRDIHEYYLLVPCFSGVAVGTAPPSLSEK